jgi:hypothetical protein
VDLDERADQAIDDLPCLFRLPLALRAASSRLALEVVTRTNSWVPFCVTTSYSGQSREKSRARYPLAPSSQNSQTRPRTSRPQHGHRRAWRRNTSNRFWTPESSIKKPAPIVAAITVS